MQRIFLTLFLSLLCAPWAAADTIPADQTSARHASWRNIGDQELYFWNANVWLDYTLDFGDGGDWETSLTAINKDNSNAPGLPGGYQFTFDVFVDGNWRGKLYVPGSSTKYQTGTFSLENLPAGTHTIRFTWLNDAWSAGNYDANVRVKEVQFTDLTPPASGISVQSIAVGNNEWAYADHPNAVSVTADNQGSDPVEYRLLKNGTVLFDWQAQPNFSWIPDPQELGSMQLTAEVRNADLASGASGVEVFVIRHPVNAN